MAPARRRVAVLLATSALSVLTACADAPRNSPETPVSAPPSLQGAVDCNAAAAQFAVGRNVDAALIEDARREAGARTARALRPGQSVTMEFSAQRLNLDVDPQGKVVRARCG